jgi:hypothetical protein
MGLELVSLGWERYKAGAEKFFSALELGYSEYEKEGGPMVERLIVQVIEVDLLKRAERLLDYAEATFAMHSWSHLKMRLVGAKLMKRARVRYACECGDK